MMEGVTFQTPKHHSEVRSLTSAPDLGEVLAIYRTRSGITIFYFGVGLFVLGFLIGLGMAFSGEGLGGLITFVSIGLASLWFIIPGMLIKSKVASVHSRGLLFIQEREEVRIPWEEIVSLQENLMDYSFLSPVPVPLPGVTSHRYTIVDVHGRKHLLTESWARVREFYDQIVEHTFPIIMRRAVETIACGKAFSFGPVAVNATEMIHGKRRYSWDDIRYIQVVRNHVNIKKHKSLLAAGVPIAKFLNFHVFLEIVQRLGKLRE
jgi:hypothetical protein